VLFATAWLPLTTLLRGTSVEAKRLSIPPAAVSLAAEPIESVEPEVLFVTRVFVSVRRPFDHSRGRSARNHQECG
jgi:hypothetical protein